MIEDLLQAAKLNSGTLELVREPFVLRELVTDTVDLLSAKAQPRAVSFASLRSRPTRARVGRCAASTTGIAQSDRQCSQVHGRGKSGGIHVMPVPGEADDQDAVQFEVADTGIGIPPDQCDRIFERFSQVDSRASRAYGGVGLGLSICQQLIGLMGGCIRWRASLVVAAPLP
jgi:signal transduction histidine kinase